MIGYIIKKIVGSKNDREVRKLRPMVAQINGDRGGVATEARRVPSAKKTANGRPVAPPSRTRTKCAARCWMKILPEAFAS